MRSRRLLPTALPGSPAPALSGIFAASATRAVGITNDGRILLWNGATWTTLGSGYGSLKSVWGIDADHFLIAEDKSPSLIRLTLDGTDVELGQEALPFVAGCVPDSLSISGKSATDIYVAAYCRSIDYDDYAVGITGVLFHSTGPDAGSATDRTWSVKWSSWRPPSGCRCPRRRVRGGAW